VVLILLTPQKFAKRPVDITDIGLIKAIKLYVMIKVRNTKITPWSRVLPEKLTCLKLLKKFPAFYGTQGFITAFTRACHLFL
jgi:hypothetical protein